MAGDQGPGTADLGPEATARGPASPPSPTEGKVRCGVWNMRGFVSNDHCRLREKVIIASDLDLLCVCETFLRGNDGINIPGYRWFGNNRLNISKRAVRGSGGVGILIKDSLFNKYSIDIVDKNYEDIIWVSCTQTKDPDQVLYICVCYLPPASSSRGDKSHEFFDILKQQILQFQVNGEIIICGDFNARIGNLNDNLGNTEPVPQRECLDTVINSHGRQLVDFLRDCDI